VASVSDVWRSIGSRSYVVQTGDTWASIAAAKGSTAAALATANRMNLSRRPSVGSRIQVPGTWGCPVPTGGFINDFGFPRPAGRVHEGNDLFAARGTPVRAPVSGQAERTPNSIGGNAVQLRGDDGNRYYLAHLDSSGRPARSPPATWSATSATRATPITTPPHLHFEVHPNGGQAVNPFPTITLACRH